MNVVVGVFHTKNGIFSGIVKCSAGTHGEAVGTLIVVQRVHVAGIEVQVARVRLRVGAVGPIVAVRAHIRQSAGGVRAVAGSGEEVPLGIGGVTLELPALAEGADDVELRRIRGIVAGACEAGEGARGRHHVAHGARVVDGLDGRGLIVVRAVGVERCVPEVVEARQGVPVVARVVVPGEEEVRVLDRFRDGLRGELVAVRAADAEAGVGVAVDVVERALRAGAVDRSHRILASPLEVRVVLVRAGGVPDSAEVFGHQRVLDVRVVLECLRAQGVGGAPDQPGPHDIPAGVLDDEQGVAVGVRDGRDRELDVLAVSSFDQRDRGDHAGGRLPEQLRGGGLAVGVLLDEGRGDQGAEVVDEVGLVGSALVGVGGRVGDAVLDGVAIDERELVRPRRADDVGVRGGSQDRRCPVRGEHRQVLRDGGELRCVKTQRVAVGVGEDHGAPLQERRIRVEGHVFNVCHDGEILELKLRC